MYEKRIKIFVAFLAFMLLVCILRLAQMQLYSGSYYRTEIARLKSQRGSSHQLQTLRGRILDRKARPLAADEPRFELYLNYTLSRFFDERIQRARLLTAARNRKDPIAARAKAETLIRTKLRDIEQIIEKCAHFNCEPADVENRIRRINDAIWNMRAHQAWKREYPESESFAQAEPDPDKRLRLAAKVDLAEMHKNWRLLDLKSNDDILTAQLEFADFPDVAILPKPHRIYYYGSTAAQTIGWVGPEQEKTLFAHDKLLTYLEDEVSGRRPGVEYVCETILRGRRGEVFVDIDKQKVEHAKTQLGCDVTLTLDIELQREIEHNLLDCRANPNCTAPTAAVVIDVDSGDILALVSIPLYDLNSIRNDYGDIESDPKKPLINRAIYKQYPPGSVIKPLILIAALQAGKITAHEIIPCPAEKAPRSWPSCWVYNKFQTGHDYDWENHARNAIRGSCNIYFSRLAERIPPPDLQRWLYNFGYGRRILFGPAAIGKTNSDRNFRQAQGQISNTRPAKTISDPAQLPPLRKNERRWFGMGQGNLRATPLQVANAFALIARGGIYKPPRLFIEDANEPPSGPTNLNIVPHHLAVVRDGMHAVVNEHGGTAYRAFEDVDLRARGVEIYGKTGSTQDPDNAWFGGFVEDRKGRAIALAVVVEQGQSGARDAAPLARKIIHSTIRAGYIGNPDIPLE